MDPCVGTLIATNFKIVFKPGTSQTSNEIEEKYLPSHIKAFFSIPLTFFLKFEKQAFDKKAMKPSYIDLVTKDKREMRFTFGSREECEHGFTVLSKCAYPDNLLTDLFAFRFFDTNLTDH